MIQEFEKIRVLVSHNGLVHWEPGGVFTTTCDIDITYFPFDKQVHHILDLLHQAEKEGYCNRKDASFRSS